MAAEAVTVEIARLGALGDGIAETADGIVHVPLALPGERALLAQGGGSSILPPLSPERRSRPLCPHFPACGGCTVQHMSEPLYRHWKHALVAEAFARRGLQVEVAPLVVAPLRSRRRAALTARFEGGRVALGYHAPRAHRLESIEACAVLDPAITDALPGLRALAGLLLARTGEARITVLATAAGLDVAIEGSLVSDLPPDRRAGVLGTAQQLPVIRLTVDDEPWLVRASPVVVVGGVPVTPPPGGFVQAVEHAEDEIVRLTLAAVGKAKRIADLFCGLGTLTFPLARTASVTAFDSDTRAIAALSSAARHAQRLKPIEPRVRNLVESPLSAREFNAFDTVVLDPPYAGAKRQCEALARSKVPLVVAISCNPTTLARDARALVDGGYRLGRVTPIDQFLYSAHVEVVVELRKD